MYYVGMPNQNARFLKILQTLMDAQNPPWSPADLARATKMHEGTISHFFKGTRKPSRDSIQRIADALGVSMAYLMEETENPLPTKEESLPEYALEVLNSMKKLDKARRYELMIIARSFVSASEELAGISHEELISLAMDAADEIGDEAGNEQFRKFLTALEAKQKGASPPAMLPGASGAQPDEPQQPSA